MTAWLVDVHNHVMPSSVLELLEREPAYGVRFENNQWIGVHHVPFTIEESFRDPAAKLAELDSFEIATAVVSPPPLLFYYEIDSDLAGALCDASNDGMSKFCAAAPNRLRWLANLPMQDPPRAVETYRAALASGCSGAAIGTSIAGRRLDEPAFAEFWSFAETAGRPVLMHPAFNESHAGLDQYYLQNVIGNPLETTVAVERMICAGVFSRHPGLRLVVLHGGGYLPYQAGRLAHACGVRPEIPITAADVSNALRQVYFDTITHDDAALAYLVSRAGADHVVLGTDLPFDMALRDPGKVLDRVFGADTPLRRLIGNETPAALFGI